MIINGDLHEIYEKITGKLHEGNLHENYKKITRKLHETSGTTLKKILWPVLGVVFRHSHNTTSTTRGECQTHKAAIVWAFKMPEMLCRPILSFILNQHYKIVCS